MARSQMQEHIIFRWLSLKSTLEYLGEWEILYNPDFNYTEFGTIKNAAGSNNFVLSVKTWIARTNAIGIRSKTGRYGGTYAHRDIAYHFGMWIAPKFQLLLVKEYQRLKSDEQKQLGWSAKRELSKINYRIHTDAIKQHLIPTQVTQAQASIIYANEADVLSPDHFYHYSAIHRAQCLPPSKALICHLRSSLRNNSQFSNMFHNIFDCYIRKIC